MKKLKIGIIGCGAIATHKHGPSLTDRRVSDLCEIVAFCDLIEEKAAVMAKDFGTPDAKVYVDYKDLLGNKDVDVVHVCTPNISHSFLTVDALDAGKHVLCEKPMAIHAVEAQKMMDAWKRSGKKFTVGFQNRFRPEVQVLKKYIEAGDLGEIYYGKAYAVRRRAVPNWGVFSDKAKQGGGPLIDIGGHAIDLTLWMMDNYEPVTVSGTVFHKMINRPDAVDGNMWGPWDYQSFDVEDSAMGFVRMKNGAIVNIEASWALNILDSREASTTVCGTKAGAEIRSGMGYPVDQLIINRGKAGVLMEESLTAKGVVAYFEGVNIPPGIVEARQWLLSIMEDTNPTVQPQQAFAVTQIMDAIYQSAALGKELVVG